MREWNERSRFGKRSSGSRERRKEGAFGTSRRCGGGRWRTWTRRVGTGETAWTWAGARVAMADAARWQRAGEGQVEKSGRFAGRGCREMRDASFRDRHGGAGTPGAAG